MSRLTERIEAKEKGETSMTILTHDMPSFPLRKDSSWHGRLTSLRARRRIVVTAKRAYQFAVVLLVFGTILVATMALRLAIWVPALHR
jgi:Zn-dependent membrane protease YugP